MGFVPNYRRTSADRPVRSSDRIARRIADLEDAMRDDPQRARSQIQRNADVQYESLMWSIPRRSIRPCSNIPSLIVTGAVKDGYIVCEDDEGDSSDEDIFTQLSSKSQTQRKDLSILEKARWQPGLLGAGNVAGESNEVTAGETSKTGGNMDESSCDVPASRASAACGPSAHQDGDQDDMGEKNEEMDIMD